LRLPRDIDYDKLIKLLNRCGYIITRQTGSHVRMTRNATEKLPEHHITIPAHSPIRIGTLSRILNDVAEHLGINRDKLLQKIER
jgi:predicted RNA binding protein YcfA (HicA-like mRNA interferase family)